MDYGLDAQVGAARADLDEARAAAKIQVRRRVNRLDAPAVRHLRRI